MKQIDKLVQELQNIGFEIEKNEEVLQILAFKAQNEDDSTDFSRFQELLQIVIELEDPFCENPHFLFQNCSLKIYFEDWSVQETAKIIKLQIANILNENNVFYGMNFEIPKSHEEVLVP